MHQLSDTIDRKFVETLDASDWEVETDSGWQPVVSSNKTIPYDVYRVTTETGRFIECADDHILFTEDLEQIFAKDCENIRVMTEDGAELVTSVVKTERSENMYDLTVASEEHRFYANGFLNHNTTIVAAILLWYALFNSDKSILILAQKAKGARNVLRRIQIMYEFLPKWMKVPVVEWNKGSIELENGSWLTADATGPDAGRGESISILYLDEFAIVNRNIQNEFMASVYPTITSGEETKVIITTTPKGFDAFYRIWQDSKAGKNSFVREVSYWWEVPGRDEKWKQEQIQALGSERAFNQEFGIEFLGNSNTLIDSRVLENMREEDPVWEKSDGLRVYEYPEERHTYMIGVDCGEGVGGDYSVISVLDITSRPFKQVAVLQNNNVIPPLFPELIYNVASMYNNAYVLIELNGPGAEVANDLVYELEYDNILWTANQGRKGQVLTAGIGGKRLQPGVKTTTATKQKGVLNLKGIVENDQLVIKDKETIYEMMNFIRVGNSYQGEEGHNDDIVMSLVVFAWATTQDFFSQLSKENVRNMMAKRKEKERQEMTPAPMAIIYDDPTVPEFSPDRRFPGFLQEEEEDELWW